ncbi:NfeD family protein [Streptomyces sp. NPDC060194]|uniref:NfeD family protein n=1 Tax=Streptomyces sp. NPDC060194 TaxID=3347069 RepID=UPI00364ED7E0
MEPWLIWLTVAAVLAAAEIFTLTAALGLLGGAALVSAGAAGVGAPVPVQFVVFTLVSAAGLLFVRPVAMRNLRAPQQERFGIDALVGSVAHAVTEVSARGGRVRIGGEEWTARPYDETLVIPEGAAVDVMEITGSTAIVYPRE